MKPISVIMTDLLTLQEQNILQERNSEEESSPLEIEGLSAKDIRAIIQEFDNGAYRFDNDKYEED